MTFDIKILNKNLKPGLTYNILSGEYHNNRINISAVGTETQPITINGKDAMITDKTTIKITGSYIIFQGFTFRNLNSKKPIKIEGTNIRFTKNVIEELSNDSEQCIQISGKNNRIDNNTFRTIRCMGALISVMNKFNLIDNNNFSDRFPQNDGKTGQEIIRIGDSKTFLQDYNCIIYGNKFNNCSGEIEIISVKGCKNIISNNTINDSEGQICLRQGKNNYVLRNYINGCKKLGASGVRLTDSGHIIQFNTFENLVDEEPFRSPIGIMCNTLDITITNNDFINCFTCFAIGIDHKKSKNILPNKLNINTNRIIKCNYMFSKSKKNKGYGEDVSITNNPLIKYDQKLNLFTAYNPEKVDFTKFYDSLLKVIPESINEEEEYKEQAPDSFTETKIINLTKRLEYSNLFIKKYKELKILRKQSVTIFGKIKSIQKELDDLIKL